jgi:hypothetical protein
MKTTGAVHSVSGENRRYGERAHMSFFEVQTLARLIPRRELDRATYLQ